MKRYAWRAAGVGAGLLALYMAGPLWAGWHLRQAMKSRDIAALEARVDWIELRRALKPRITAAIRDDALQSGVVGGLVKRALGATLSNTAVDTFVTPANLSRLLAGRAFLLERLPGSTKTEPPTEDVEDADDPVPPRRLRWAFFESPTRFRVESVHPKLSNARIVSILALQGVSWRLVDVDIIKK
jgi:hypothetical protein